MITWMCIPRIATKYNKPQKQKTGDIHFKILCCVDLFKAWVGIWVMFFFGWVTLTLIYRDPWLTTMPGVTAEGIFPPPPSLRVSATVLRSPFSSPPGEAWPGDESWTIKDGNGWNMSSNGKIIEKLQNNMLILLLAMFDCWN